MAPNVPRLRILSVGGNSVSAFLSWRLQATNACDVTLVWKSGFDAVHQYGISFRSQRFGNERFKPRRVVRSPEEASNTPGPFDYVLLCVKALPDVYDLAAVIESVVTPQHTCILINTTHTLGVESHLEQRFPTNVVLSLVSGAEITQLGASEFEHQGSTEIWVGPANKNPAIPASIQSDMAEALAMTLSSGQVDCKVSENIRQQQYEKMIGQVHISTSVLGQSQELGTLLTLRRAIAFHPASVLFETPTHSELMQKTGVRSMVSDVLDELLQIAASQQCTFPESFKQSTIDSMTQPSETQSTMYQDFMARRPMEVETYLGSPIKLAQEAGIKVPRIDTLYAILHHFNVANQNRTVPPAGPAVSVPPQPAAPPRPMTNGNGGRGGRIPSGYGPPPPGRRAPPSINGYPPRPPPGHPFPARGPPGPPPKRTSFEANDLEEFSHLVLYDDIPEGDVPNTNGAYGEMGNGVGGSASELALRERELMLRQRELALREQEYGMRRGSRRPPPPQSHRGGFDEDEEEDYYDSSPRPPPQPAIDPDNFDMMSVTSRRTRKMPSASQMRKNPEMSGQMRSSQGHGGLRPNTGRRSSARLLQDVPGLHDSLMDNPMMGYSSNRYGTVDRKMMGDESRANSLTAARLDELQQGGPTINVNGGYPTPTMSRRTSHSPGHPFPPGPHGGPVGPGGPGALAQRNGRPSPPNGYGRPSPPAAPGAVQQPVPRYPPGQGNRVAPQQVEQHAGVSNLYPPKGPPNVRSLTGSASASAGSGDSGASAQIDSENSAHSSQSSLGRRAANGVKV
ncbi:MAG: hypothetical protein M1837_002671 [Sclerophora amabilis]|nr:MAG: hypothetical protein M1837_002671 [Sclerophora amabilis]